MEHELERTVDQGEDVRLQLEEEEERTRDLLHENKEKNSLIEQLNNQVIFCELSCLIFEEEKNYEEPF